MTVHKIDHEAVIDLLDEWQEQANHFLNSAGEITLIPKFGRLTRSIACWCDAGYCSVAPEPLLDFYVILSARITHIRSEDEIKELLKRAYEIAMPSFWRMLHVAFLHASGEFHGITANDDGQWKSITKKKLAAVLGISERSLRKWLDENSSQVKELSRTAKIVQVHTSIIRHETNHKPT